MSGRLAGKMAFVTGAGRGIGAAVADAFVAEGAAVFIAELDAESGAAKAAELRARGGRAGSSVCDVADRGSVEAAVAAAKRELGSINVLVNNAGVNVFRDPLTMTEADWRRCLGIDLEGPLHACRAVLPDMLAQGYGSIVNIASIHSFSIIPGCFPSPVAKHGLLGLAKVVAKEGAKSGIRSNVICPGFVRTPLVEKQIPEQAKELGISEADVIKTVMLKDTVDGEFTTIQDVAQTAVFLAAFATNALTGQSITVSHGWHMQ